ncbi:hypothetical protein L1887_57328 [Cichorium endivia]|nr:hypothetical protein L1887_57328 [Cichorium endivia]
MHSSSAPPLSAAASSREPRAASCAPPVTHRRRLWPPPLPPPATRNRLELPRPASSSSSPSSSSFPSRQLTSHAHPRSCLLPSSTSPSAIHVVRLTNTRAAPLQSVSHRSTTTHHPPKILLCTDTRAPSTSPTPSLQPLAQTLTLYRHRSRAIRAPHSRRCRRLHRPYSSLFWTYSLHLVFRHLAQLQHSTAINALPPLSPALDPTSPLSRLHRLHRRRASTNMHPRQPSGPGSTDAMEFYDRMHTPKHEIDMSDAFAAALPHTVGVDQHAPLTSVPEDSQLDTHTLSSSAAAPPTPPAASQQHQASPNGRSLDKLPTSNYGLVQPGGRPDASSRTSASDITKPLPGLPSTRPTNAEQLSLPATNPAAPHNAAPSLVDPRTTSAAPNLAAFAPQHIPRPLAASQFAPSPPSASPLRTPPRQAPLDASYPSSVEPLRMPNSISIGPFSPPDADPHRSMMDSNRNSIDEIRRNHAARAARRQSHNPSVTDQRAANGLVPPDARLHPHPRTRTEPQRGPRRLPRALAAPPSCHGFRAPTSFQRARDPCRSHRSGSATPPRPFSPRRRQLRHFRRNRHLCLLPRHQRRSLLPAALATPRRTRARGTRARAPARTPPAAATAAAKDALTRTGARARAGTRA